MSTIDLTPAPIDPIKQALFEVLDADREELPTSGGTRLRGSFAWSCTRRIGYEVLGIPRDYEPDGAALAAFDVGHGWHETIQKAYVHLYDAHVEVDVDLSHHGHEMSTHCDLAYEAPEGLKTSSGMKVRPGAVVAGEIKSKGSYPYKLYCEGMKGHWAKNKTEPIGPEAADVVQCAISGIGLGAGYIELIYTSKDKSGEMTRWIAGIDERLPHLPGGPSALDLALGDLKRMKKALEVVDGGELPERYLPQVGVVGSPPGHHSNGAKGSPWQCRYCPWNANCREQPATRLPLEGVRGWEPPVEDEGTDDA